MVDGFVVNNTGRYKHIFKRGIFPGMSIPLKDLYETYCYKYDGDFDLDFVKWLEDTKLIDGFDVVIDSYEPEESVNDVEVFSPGEKNITQDYSKITFTDIANLKIKDNPKEVISNIDSVAKLRRALTTCKGMKGRRTIIKYIKERIAELT